MAAIPPENTMALEEVNGILNTCIAKLQAGVAETTAFIANLPAAIHNASTIAMAHVSTRPTEGRQPIIACVYHPGTCLVLNCLFITFMVLNWFWASDKVVNLLQLILSLAMVLPTFLIA